MEKIGHRYGQHRAIGPLLLLEHENQEFNDLLVQEVVLVGVQRLAVQ